MKPIIVIPARSGSKRLPGKNLMSIGGMTLIRRCIGTALATGLGQVWVNTDSDDIYLDALPGANVFLRPIYLGRDDTTTEEVIADMARKQQWIFDQPIILMQCTSPFTTKEDIIALYANYRRHQPVALCRADEAKPCGAGYVFPAILPLKGMLFDPAINWGYYNFSNNGDIDVDTQEDFDKALAQQATIESRGGP